MDGNGSVYVVWGHANGFDPNTNLATRGVEIDYAFSKDGGSTWAGPFKLSTEGGTSTFPAMTVAATGTLDVAWYGDPAHAVDPNADTSGQWNLYYARVIHANTPTPSVSPKVLAASPGPRRHPVHHACRSTRFGAVLRQPRIPGLARVTAVHARWRRSALVGRGRDLPTVR